MSAWQGLGGPVDLDRPDYSNIDPALDDCCRREAESHQRQSVLEATLRRHDVSRLAERQRRHLIPHQQTSLGMAACRCCYDPNRDGGEYRALVALRQERNGTLVQPQDEKEDEEPPKGDDSISDEDDDEFDYLLEEELPENSNNGIKALEERRRAELELALLHRDMALWHGYGVHRQMHPSRVLRAAGLTGMHRTRTTTSSSSPAVVLHLFDPDSFSSASLDMYLERLAATTYRGTKFLRADGRSTLLLDAALASKVLPRLLPDADMPTLVAIRDGLVVAVCPNLNGLVDVQSDDEGKIVPEAVREWLDRAGVLREKLSPWEEMCRVRPEEEALYDHSMAQANVQPRFDCGIPTCQKNFPHEHVGVQNEQQDGLVIQEEKVLGEDGGSS